MNEIEKRNLLWDIFDKLNDKNKIEWLLEFDSIFSQVRNWEEEILDEEIKRLKEIKKNE